MVSVAELMKDIGKTVLVRDGEIQYEVKIVDVKTAYGQIRYLVRPVAGSGEKWVMSFSILKQ